VTVTRCPLLLRWPGGATRPLRSDKQQLATVEANSRLALTIEADKRADALILNRNPLDNNVVEDGYL
jgi:hypothetical protein